LAALGAVSITEVAVMPATVTEEVVRLMEPKKSGDAPSAGDRAVRRPLLAITSELWIMTIVGAAIVAVVVGLS
jgi:hypothetical protein